MSQATTTGSGIRDTYTLYLDLYSSKNSTSSVRELTEIALQSKKLGSSFCS
jgi:hypothetical protein